MQTLQLITLACVLLSTTGCTKLDAPFQGVTAANIFALTLVPSPGKTENTLPADGRSALECVISLKNENTLYSQVVVTAASDDMLLSLTGSATGATNTLIVPFAGRESRFYALAPRDFHETVRFNVSIGNVRQVMVVNLTEVFPSRIDVTPAVIQATAGTSFSFITTLSDTLLVPKAVSGLLPVQFTLLSTTTKSTPRLPLGRSVAQADGTATVTTTVTLADTGTFRFRARVQGVGSQPFVVRCR